MSIQFDRKYRLIISEPPQLNSETKIINPESDNKVVVSNQDFRTESLDSIIIEDLNIKAVISSSKNKSSSSSATLEIKGLSQQNLNFIRDNGVVILQAGFENQSSLPIILAGQIINNKSSTKGDTTFIKLTVSDAYVPNSSVKVSKEYPEQTTYETILEDLASVYASNGIPLGRPIGALEGKQGVGVDLPIDALKITFGTCLAGYLDNVMKQVCKECGFTFYISNARLYVEPENYTENATSFNFTSSNILSLEKSTAKGNTNSKDTQENSQGYNLEMYLDGRIEVGSFITFNIDGELIGTFKVISVKHTLDYEGVSWFTNAELQNV